MSGEARSRASVHRNVVSVASARQFCPLREDWVQLQQSSDFLRAASPLSDICIPDLSSQWRFSSMDTLRVVETACLTSLPCDMQVTSLSSDMAVDSDMKVDVVKHGATDVVSHCRGMWMCVCQNANLDCDSWRSSPTAR